MNPDLQRRGLLVHEWLEQTGGSENVFEAMASTFPDAPIVAAWNNAPNRFGAERVSETWLARTPLRRSKPLAALALTGAWRSASIASDSRWALVSTHLFAHHVRLPPRIPKLVYVHTPARYVWSPELDPRGAGRLARAVAGPLKVLDRRRAKEATSIVANSRFVQRRIEQNWGLSSGVLHPPVAVERVRAEVAQRSWRGAIDADVIDSLPDRFLLGVSRFVSYKRLDAVISAGEETGLPVVLAGAGPDEGALRARAAASSVPVEFIIRPTSAVLFELYRRSTVVVFPAIEDFGIVPVEAMAVGTPVVGIRAGGLCETVLHGTSGYLVDDFGGVEIRRAVAEAEKLDPLAVSAHADRFSDQVFQRRLSAWVEQHVVEAGVFA